MIKNTQGGFTLIELLVVVAIIGILSGTVISAVGTARERANASAVKTNLASIRTQSEIVYDTRGAYNVAAQSVCTGSGLTQDATIARAIAAATSANGGTAVVCNQTATAWAVSSILPTSGAGHWCVDSQGVAKGIASALGSGVVVCP